MANKLDAIKLPPGADRRITVTEDVKENVRRYYRECKSIRETTRAFNISRRYVQFIIYPERLERHKQLAAKRRKDGRYYDRVQHTLSVKSLRAHKLKLLRDGVLKLPRKND